MIKININGNRSDIIGYVSYYSCEEISKLLDIKEEDIIYETSIVDYFLHGDITFESEIIVHVTITDNYFEHIQELTNILVKYVGFFTNKCQVYYDVIDNRLVYNYEVKEKKKQHEHSECSCSHHDCDCGEDHDCNCTDECSCSDECNCDEEHSCGCNHDKNNFNKE